MIILNKEALSKILECKIPQLYNCREILNQDNLKTWGCEICFEGEVIVDDVRAKIIIGFNKYFPINKPLYFLYPWNQFGFIPHVEPDGYICYVQEENLVFDTSNPEGILNETLNKAISTLEKGEKKENTNDFLDEFEAYWAKITNKNKKAVVTFELPNSPVRVFLGIADKLRVFGEDEIQTKRVFNRLLNEKLGRIDSAVYVPLKEGVITQPPSYDNFWKHSEIMKFIYSSIDENDLRNLIKHKPGKEEYIILGIPKPNKEKALVGIVYRTKNEKYHPLLNADSNAEINPIDLYRIGVETIVPRGGGNINLFTKRILIAGCGSLGGQLICDLAKTGIGNIDICDFDTLKHENSYRHVLGAEYVGQNKAEAIKHHLEKQLPFITIRTIKTKIEYWINNENFEKQNYDAVILATANDSSNLYINEIMKTKYPMIPVLYTWLEPFGIGGHVLLTTNKSKGCFNCLFDKALHNRASFTNPEQRLSFAVSKAGCGSLYVPFSNLDALKTSNLAARLLLSYFNGKEKDNPLLSWKGDSEIFEQEGYFLSERFKQQTEEQMFEKRYNYKEEVCRHCGGK